MPQLTISRVNGSKQRVAIAADDGTLVECYEANLLSPRAQKRLSDATGIPGPQIAAAAMQLGAKGADPVMIPFASAGSDAPVGPFAVVLREQGQPLDTGTTFEASTPAAALLQALAVEGVEGDAVLQWEGTDRLCCLDIDYHGIPFDQRPSLAWLEVKAATLHPRPFAFHASHGRGMKLYYVALPGLTARELASVGAVGWLSQDVRATADLVRITRPPRCGYSKYPDARGGPVHTQTPGDDLLPVAKWLQRAVDPDAVEDFLDARGWKQGDRLEHTDCPIDPGPASGAPSVYVGEDGIYCHRCAAKGLSLGRSPGYTSFASMVGGFPPRAVVMLKNATHWSHAKLILRAETRLPEPILKEAYSAALKLVHGPDSPQTAAMFAGADMIRMPGRWVSTDGTTTYANNLHGLLNALPAVWVPGTREVAADKRDLFLQGGDLSHHGYPAVTPIHGCNVYAHHMTPSDGRVTFAVPAAWCREPRYAPRYVGPSLRMKVSEARSCVEEVFPGIHWAYLDLLIALKGLAEGNASQAPFAIVTGPSASGKTTTAFVAASICGDVCSEAKFTPDGVRLIQTISEALDKGSFAVLNEVFKEAERAKLQPRAAVDPILTLTPNVLAHKMYVGPRPLGKLPALILTDISIPSSVHSDLQLARRLVWVHQPHRVHWDANITKTCGEAGRFRLWSPEAADACNAILSDVIDRYFRLPTTLREIAADLGLGTLEDCGGVVDLRLVMKAFFDEVLAAPDLTGAEAQRFPGGGWKVIDRGDSTKLRDLWDELADSTTGAEWHSSRVADAEDWSTILGTASPIRFSRGNWRGKTFVRFQVGGSKPTWVSKQGAAVPE
jgi:hypothetical protein